MSSFINISKAEMLVLQKFFFFFAASFNRFNILFVGGRFERALWEH